MRFTIYKIKGTAIIEMDTIINLSGQKGVAFNLRKDGCVQAVPFC
jgi:hypothetical protein